MRIFWLKRDKRCLNKGKNEQKVSKNTNKNYFFLFFPFFICLTMTMPNKITDVKRSGPVQTQSANGISINKFNRFIILPISKQKQAISCKIFTFFISYHLFKCIITYFSRKFKCFPRSRISITPYGVYIINSAGIAYHQHEVLYIIIAKANTAFG